MENLINIFKYAYGLTLSFMLYFLCLQPKVDDHKSLGTGNGADDLGVFDSNTDLTDGAAASQNRPDVSIPKDGTAQQSVQTTSATTLWGNTENYPFKLGKIIMVQAFEAALALMIFRFKPQGVDSSPALSSFMFTMVGAIVLFGFTFTLIGLMLQKVHPAVATVSSHAGSISAVLGFFFMMAVFVPERYVWSLCASAGVLSMVYVYSLAKPSHITYSSTPFSLSKILGLDGVRFDVGITYTLILLKLLDVICCFSKVLIILEDRGYKLMLL